MNLPDAPSATAAPPSAPLDVATLRLRVDDRGRLFALRGGGGETLVTARRAFPWSMPDRLVSLRDKEGVELLLIDAPDALPADARAALARALGDGTFIPRIRRIERIDIAHGYQLWRVDTESGPLELRVQEREDIRFLTDRRFSVKDANGNVYEIVDSEALDAHSRRELSRII